MELFIRVLLGVALAFTLLDIVYNGRTKAGRSLVYAGVFTTLALVFHFTANISQ
jgi:hypothetical protein